MEIKKKVIVITFETTTSVLRSTDAFQPGIYRDKTIADKLMYIPNNDTQNYLFFRLQLVVEKFGHLTYQTKQSKFNNSPQSCKANK